MQKEAVVFVIRLQRNLIVWKIISWFLPIIFWAIVTCYLLSHTLGSSPFVFIVSLFVVSILFYFLFIKRDIKKIKKNISEIAKNKLEERISKLRSKQLCEERLLLIKKYEIILNQIKVSYFD